MSFTISICLPILDLIRYINSISSTLFHVMSENRSFAITLQSLDVMRNTHISCYG